MPELSLNDGEMNALNGNFVCGVVEGFYGRPWTTCQRKELFKRTSKMGMNTYLYAPKDDCKHRMYWRELYSVEEADHLTGLINAAKEQNVTFVYALSPGLDITFSSSKEVTYLKRKLEQVSLFGCTAFALLFDDIDTDMSEPDKEIFQSFAHAQVSVTNEVYQHLNQPPLFLFCPTEYCATRAVPSVANSEYLTTVGSKLLPGVDVLWTGPKVVSKRITIQSIEEVATVLKRPPVIWDNIHANDYDQKRLFLGPYDGRSPELIPYLRGVLTNPNCEFEANFIAMHTLAQWSKSNSDGVKKDIILSESPVNSDIRLETESEFSADEDFPGKFHHSYQPKAALTTALTEWLEVFYVTRSAQGPVQPTTPTTPLTQSVNTCMTVTPTTNTPVGGGGPPISSPSSLPPPLMGLPENLNAHVIHAVASEVNDSYMQPQTVQTMNSLLPAPAGDSQAVEPMDCVPTNTASALTAAVDNTSTAKSGEDLSMKSDSDSVMQIDTDKSEVEPPSSLDFRNSSKKEDLLTHEDLALLVDLFYLPFEHGSRAVHMLTEFHWLKTNAHRVTENAVKESLSPEDKVCLQEWRDRAAKFEELVKAVSRMAEKLSKIPNRALLYDMYAYLWDMRGVLSVLNSFVKWLALGQLPYISVCYFQGAVYTWSNKGYRDVFMSGNQEPWVFRGGLTAEFQRMLPIESVNDLFVAAPCVPPTRVFTIRPYLPSDEAAVYEICRRTCDDGMDGTDIFPDQPNLIGDKLVGAFLSISPQYCFVMEDDDRVCGYVLAALDSQLFYRDMEEKWIPKMCQKYPKPEKVDNLSPAEEIIMGFYQHKSFIPPPLHEPYPSLVRIDVMPAYADQAITKRIMACTLSALKANGTRGVHCEVSVGEKYLLDLYARLGFLDVNIPGVPENSLILGRVV